MVCIGLKGFPLSLSITICTQNPKGKMIDEIVIGNLTTHVRFFSFLLGTSCILQFSEIQGEVINPLGLPNEWDTNTILLLKTYHSCFYLGIKTEFLNVAFIR